jgi:hypothetical protein
MASNISVVVFLLGNISDKRRTKQKKDSFGGDPATTIVTPPHHKGK